MPMADASLAPPPWVSGLTVADVLARTAAAHPDRDALVFPSIGVRWSWAELARRVDRAARGLVAAGVAAGEHLGIWSMNAPEWVLTQFAAARLGAVLVNVNPGYRTFELEEALALADVATLVVGRPFKSSDFVGLIQTVCPEAAAAADRNWSCPRLPKLKRLVALGDRPGPGWLTWDDLERGEASPPEELDARRAGIAAGDVANIQFTSGTTGLPKAAMLTHSNLLMNAYHVGRRLRYTDADRVCVPVPFYHCFGCVLGTLVGTVAGAAIVVPSLGFDSAATVEAMERERCTSVYGVPTMFVGMLEQAAVAGCSFPHLRTGIMSGAPCPLPLMQEVVDRLGAREICIGYGQTEASPIITFTAVDDPIEVRCRTVGRPIPGVEVKLVDPATRAEVTDGRPGEIAARGHNVMAGYYKNPDATRRAIDDEGWLHTGDLATRRHDGNYRIVGRSKDQINRGGEKISPAEVEEFLHHHPDVAEVAVLGIPDARYGEIVAAWVVPRAGASPSPEDIVAFCRGKLTHYKIPEHVAIVPTLPRTVTGKVRKHVLKDQAILDLGLGDVASIETA